MDGRNPIRIRRAVLSDALAIATVHIQSWQTAYRGIMPEDYLNRLAPSQRYDLWVEVLTTSNWPRSAALVAENSEGVVGFAHLRPTRDEDDDSSTVAEITSIYLLPSIWSAGVGRDLMRESLKAMGEAGYWYATLWVLEVNHRARRFYDAGGWSLDGSARHGTTAGALHRELRYRRPVE